MALPHREQQGKSSNQDDEQGQALSGMPGVFPLRFQDSLSDKLRQDHQNDDGCNRFEEVEKRGEGCKGCVFHLSAFERNYPILSAFLDGATHPITMFTFGVFVGLVGPVLSFVWGF